MGHSWHVWHKRVRVGETHLGKAVFALRPFRAKQTIGVIQGVICHDPQYSSDYCMDLGQNRSLEPIPPFRYVNHSCDPNAELVSIDWGHEGVTRADQLLLEALRDIAVGEEITIDYAWNPEAAIKCHCGSANCRGWIVDEAKLSQL